MDIARKEACGSAFSRRTLLSGIGTAALTSVALAGAAAESRFPESVTGADPGSAVYLDSNENPYGPSALTIRAMQESLASTNRYPATSEALREVIASRHKVSAEQVVLGCGSTELLRMAADAFLGPRQKLLAATPTYPMLASYARARGREVVQAPLTKDRQHDLEAMLGRGDAATGLVYICNPNNPTGTLTVRRDLEEFLRRLSPSIPVVVDEAYHEYVAPTSSYASLIDRPIDDGRTIVTRSFSGIHGLAGMRLGYAVAPASMARQLSRFRLEFGTSAVAVAGAAAALGDLGHVRQSAQRNADERQRFSNHCNVRYVGVSASLTNFVLVDLDHPAGEVLDHFRRQGVRIGPQVPELGNVVRVSMGLPGEMKRFWEVWDMLPHQDRHESMSH